MQFDSLNQFGYELFQTRSTCYFGLVHTCQWSRISIRSNSYVTANVEENVIFVLIRRLEERKGSESRLKGGPGGQKEGKPSDLALLYSTKIWYSWIFIERVTLPLKIIAKPEISNLYPLALSSIPLYSFNLPGGLPVPGQECHHVTYMVYIHIYILYIYTYIYLL